MRFASGAKKTGTATALRAKVQWRKVFKVGEKVGIESSYVHVAAQRFRRQRGVIT